MAKEGGIAYCWIYNVPEAPEIQCLDLKSFKCFGDSHFFQHFLCRFQQHIATDFPLFEGGHMVGQINLLQKLAHMLRSVVLCPLLQGLFV